MWFTVIIKPHSKWSWHTSRHKVQSLSMLQAYMGSGCIAPFILYLRTRWRWVVSCMHQPLYKQSAACTSHFTSSQLHAPATTLIPTEYEAGWAQSWSHVFATMRLSHKHKWWMKSPSVLKLVFASTTGGWRDHLCCNWFLQAQQVVQEPICAAIGI